MPAVANLSAAFLPANSKLRPPSIQDNIYLVNGEVRTYQGKSTTVYTPVSKEQVKLGSFAMLTEKESTEALEAACNAYKSGSWSKLTVKQRIASIEKFVQGLKIQRNLISSLIQWEICKNVDDANKEVDRTIDYINQTLQALKDQENKASTFQVEQGIGAQTRRLPIGVVLCSSPQNYPLNESYCILFPALAMGNTCILKVPRVGVLCHFPTFELFKQCFPPGVVNVLTGSGRDAMPILMKSGKLDGFALIGTSKAANSLIQCHPKPHKLRIILGLEAKNPAIVCPSADLSNAVAECVLGSLSYNGQRCTALKVLFVHDNIHDIFLAKFSEAVDTLPVGLPWENAKITHLPELEKPSYLKELIQDALSKGALVANKTGNQFDGTLATPTVLSNVTKAMRIYNEEQFGPIVPVVRFTEIVEVLKYLEDSPYGQQASIFSQDKAQLSHLIDELVHQVCRVNINSQCQRGPDSLIFTARKDSAMGTLSVTDALRAFSIRSLVAAKVSNEGNRKLVEDIVSSGTSKFLKMEHLF